MRAFVAAVPPSVVLEPLADALPSLRERWPQMGWIPPERWHLTLCFLGDISEETAGAVSAALGSVAGGAAPIPAVVGGGGTFPGGRHARVGWGGVEARPALAHVGGTVP